MASPTLPSATTTVSETSSAPATGVNYICVMAAVPTNADSVPRVYGNANAIYTQHGYSDGLEYAALHFEETGLPLIFIGMPITTPGTVGRFNASGNTGTSVCSCAVGGSGSLTETDGVVRAVNSGTVGTDNMVIEYSLDGGRAFQRVKLGTATAYTIPYVGLALSFTAGTLVAGETILTWHSTAPMWGTTAISTAKTNLAAQSRQMRSWMVVGDITNSTFAGYITTAVNGYETANDRFVYARANVPDRLPYSTMSDVQQRMSGAPNITFLEVGVTGDTITRSAGSFITDGFVNGDTIRVTGSVSNNVVGVVATVAASVLTMDTTDLANEGPVAGVAITSEPTLTFAEVGATGDTITRNRGSWLADGFRDGDRITITGTATNNITNALVTTVTATVITLDTQDLTAEVIGTHGVTVTAGQTKAAWVAAQDAAFTTVSAQKRLDLGLGRGYKYSALTGFEHRRPVAWAASLREYRKSLDVHIPTWRKDDGPCDGWDLNDSDGDLVEFDERVDSGGLAAGFTCFRTWGNGPAGAFIAMSITRTSEASILSRTHNMAVLDVAMTVCQAETENAVGQVLQLKSDGTATPASLSRIESRVNSALARELLQEKVSGCGPRASGATWAAATDDVLNVPGATLHGVLSLSLNGTIEQVDTVVRVNPGS